VEKLKHEASNNPLLLRKRGGRQINSNNQISSFKRIENCFFVLEYYLSFAVCYLEFVVKQGAHSSVGRATGS
jgi:hypothetical protein